MMENIRVHQIVVVGGILALSAIYLYRKRRKNSIPQRWKSIGKLESLYLYPLKSARRIEVEEAECTDFGMKITQNGMEIRDRMFMVYGENTNEFKSARTYPKMILIEVKSTNRNTTSFTAPGMNHLEIQVPDESKDPKLQLILHNKDVPTIDCGDKAAEWFSNYMLGKNCGARLGYRQGGKRRFIDKEQRKFYPNLTGDATGLYSDLTSYLFINKSSISDLNQKLSNSSISEHNFRPNLVIDGENCLPYDEDKWDWIKVGDVIFRNVKPCTRCILTTVNPNTGEFSKNREPLATLEKYRRLKNLFGITLDGQRPVMGVGTGLIRGGIVKVGDPVYVESS